MYKKLDQEKPSQTFNIRGGQFSDDISKFIFVQLRLGIVSDPEEGILIESFEFRILPSRQQFTVLADS